MLECYACVYPDDLVLTNGTADIQNLQLSRGKSVENVLWATEKTNISIGGIDLLWGRVDDQYENDPSLLTIRADGFFLPAGTSSIWGSFPPGFPAAAHACAWGQLYETGRTSGENDFVVDYSGKSDYAIKSRLQSLAAQDAAAGNARIRNLIWTDMMANNLIGTQTNDTLWVADHSRTIEYDFKYAIPGLILLLIWLPSFLGSIFLLITRSLTFKHMKSVLNHTSIGRVVVGTSALRVQDRGGGAHIMTSVPTPRFHYADSSNPSSMDMNGDKGILGHRRGKGHWVNGGGSVRVILQLDHPRSGPYGEDIQLLESSGCDGCPYLLEEKLCH